MGRLQGAVQRLCLFRASQMAEKPVDSRRRVPGSGTATGGGYDGGTGKPGAGEPPTGIQTKGGTEIGSCCTGFRTPGDGVNGKSDGAL
jgi:hypothetical protein